MKGWLRLGRSAIGDPDGPWRAGVRLLRQERLSERRQPLFAKGCHAGISRNRAGTTNGNVDLPPLEGYGSGLLTHEEPPIDHLVVTETNGRRRNQTRAMKGNCQDIASL